jgi:hypothetical protein
MGSGVSPRHCTYQGFAGSSRYEPSKEPRGKAAAEINLHFSDIIHRHFHLGTYGIILNFPGIVCKHRIRSEPVGNYHAPGPENAFIFPGTGGNSDGITAVIDVIDLSVEEEFRTGLPCPIGQFKVEGTPVYHASLGLGTLDM